VVPRTRAVRLIFSSADDARNMYLPQLGVQQIAIPGRYTSIWFAATRATSFPIQCSSHCPTAAGKCALGDVSIVEPEAFEQWLTS